MNVTPRQMEVLRLIRDFRVRRGFSPTMQELANSLSVSKVTVFQHIEALEEKGLLQRSPHRARSLELSDQVQFEGPAAATLPFLGYIAAGAPIEAVEEREEMNVASMFEQPEGTFLLQVKGDSMIDEQIRDGDLVVVKPNVEPQNGQTVVALLEDGEVTLKQIYREGKRIRLQPANEAYQPIYLPAGKLTVQGVVVGIIRKYD